MIRIRSERGSTLHPLKYSVHAKMTDNYKLCELVMKVEHERQKVAHSLGEGSLRRGSIRPSASNELIQSPSVSAVGVTSKPSTSLRTNNIS